MYLNDSVINNCDLNSNLIQATATNLFLQNMEILDITSVSFWNFDYTLKVSLDSHLYINNVTYRDAWFPFLNLLSSTAEIHSLNATRIFAFFTFIRFEQVGNMTIEESSINDINSIYPFYIVDSYIQSIKSMVFEIASERHMWIVNSEIGLIEDSTFTRSRRSSSIGLINSSLNINN